MRPVYEQRADSQPGPQTALRIKELEEQIEKLPEEPREVFSLIYHLRLLQAEVAERIGISLPTVKRRYREAKELLAESLGLGGAGV